MKLLFESHDYKDFLKKLVYSDEAKRGLQAKMAKAMGCQAAYLSQVVKGNADLTEDHAVKLARFLELSNAGTNYFLVLVRLGRASSLELKRFLEQERKKLFTENERILSRSQASEASFSEKTLHKYFSSWIPSTVHMATSSENFQTVETIAKRLRLSSEKAEEILLFLVEIGAVAKKDKKWIFAGSPIHFPENSPINSVHQKVRRDQAMKALEEGHAQDIHFSSLFTISADALEELRADFLELIEKSHKKIQASGTDEIYSICLDLFKVV